MTGKDLRWIPLFNKVVDLRPATLLKKRLRHRCFSVNLVKFLRRRFSQNIPGVCLTILWDWRLKG